MQSLNDYKTVRWNVPLQPLVSFWTCAGSEGDKSLVPCFGLTGLLCCAGLHPQLPPLKQRSCSVTLLTVIPKLLFFCFGFSEVIWAAPFTPHQCSSGVWIYRVYGGKPCIQLQPGSKGHAHESSAASAVLLAPCPFYGDQLWQSL